MKKKQKKRSARLKTLRSWSFSLIRKTNPLLILNVLHRKIPLDLSQGRISNESKHGKFFSATVHSLGSSEKKGGKQCEQEEEELVVDSD